MWRQGEKVLEGEGNGVVQWPQDFSSEWSGEFRRRLVGTAAQQCEVASGSQTAPLSDKEDRG